MTVRKLLRSLPRFVGAEGATRFAPSLALVVLLVASGAFAQDPPPPPAPGGGMKEGEAPEEPREPGRKELSEEELAAQALERAKKAWAENLKKRDQNGDGKLSQEEFKGGKAAFEAFDANKDGMLDEAEYVGGRTERERERRELRRKRQAEQPPGGGARGPSPAENYFMLRDKNRDGKITPDEDNALFTGERSADLDKDGALNLEEVELVLGDSGEGDRGEFRALDGDGDGKLTGAEAKLCLEKFPGADKDANGEISSEEYRDASRVRREKLREGLRKTPAERLQALDKDKDGRVTLEEGASLLKRHPSIDANGDGVISEEELKSLPNETPDRRRAVEEMAKQLIAKFDKDGNGSLTGEEAKAAVAEHEGIDVNRDGVVDLEETMGRLAEQGRRVRSSPAISFENFDRDGDGKITREEGKDIFKMKGIDANGDEVIDKAEFDARFARKEKRREPTEGDDQGGK